MAGKEGFTQTAEAVIKLDNGENITVTSSIIFLVPALDDLTVKIMDELADNLGNVKEVTIHIKRYPA
jgi:hypothetical protein